MKNILFIVLVLATVGISVIAAKHHVWRRGTVLKVTPCAQLSEREQLKQDCAKYDGVFIDFIDVSSDTEIFDCDGWRMDRGVHPPLPQAPDLTDEGKRP